MMKCGHAANAVDAVTGAPVCVIDVATDRDVAARTVVPPSDLAGRTAKCTCGNARPTTTMLAFMGLNPEYDGVTRFDSYYCGHSGWD